MTRPWRRFRRTFSVATAALAVAGALAITPQAAVAAEDPLQVLASNVAVNTTTAESATVTFDYAPNDSVTLPAPPYSMRVYISPSNVNYWETDNGARDYFDISTPGSYNKAFTLTPGSYNLSIASYPVLDCGDCGGPEPTVFSTMPFTVTAATPTPTPTPEPTTEPAPTPSATAAPASPGASLSATNVFAGSSVTVTASGLATNEPVELWIHSTPVQLWTGTADASGGLTQAITIPADTPLGAHRIELRGATTGSLWLDLSVHGGQLAATGGNGILVGGISIGAAALIATGGLSMLLARRRKQHSNA
ncbi:hypothetical protein LQ938_11475 [Microbacterium sp. cx-55]|uniref:hypothetical protein n=1 Tax=Microbacterium sp. cx-55 TaxID=2875948 RepID=UPI001CBE29A3|nr:hypothetical protein [Microbacterium sp. cx-55]MBZ4488104.1 hypothetical protein [Microbacterium sp. cx-55]UGB34487.1 hypothetical protein LQ938_11475 [Microbacterium sp. cx-55]